MLATAWYPPVLSALCNGKCELVHTLAAGQSDNISTRPYGEAERTEPNSHSFRSAWLSMAGGISGGRCDKADSTGNEMKALMAAIALLWVSSTVLAHDIYSTLRDRDGNLCCGGQIVNRWRL